MVLRLPILNDLTNYTILNYYDSIRSDELYHNYYYWYYWLGLRGTISMWRKIPRSSPSLSRTWSWKTMFSRRRFQPLHLRLPPSAVCNILYDIIVQYNVNDIVVIIDYIYILVTYCMYISYWNVYRIIRGGVKKYDFRVRVRTTIK